MKQTNNTVEQKSRVSKWATASMFLALMGVASFFLLYFLLMFPPFGYYYYDNQFHNQLVSIASNIIVILLASGLVLIALGLVTSIIALIHIKFSKRTLKGIARAIVGLVIGLLLIAIVLFLTIVARLMPEESYIPTCAQRLQMLGVVLNMYQSDYNGQYPTSDKWYDILENYVHDRESWQCPATRGQLSNYAINPNCEPNSPNDVVLVFESKGGWNLYGQVEMLTTENHKYRAGCNILFNDKSVKFIEPEEVAELNWGKEKEN
ncbi:MAG: SLC41A family transporter [Planctomycetota bacterium]|jgi:glucan phosphoethanolaminetransferase (alkaline phosphatase superfamily)